MPFPFGFEELSPNDLKRFRTLYEESVSGQPLDKLGQLFISTYSKVDTGGFSEALTRLDMVLEASPDYASFAAAKHLLSQVDSGSAVTYQVTKRLLGHPSPLLFRYGLCLVISGDLMVDREINDAVSRLAVVDEETMSFVQVAKVAIQTGVARSV